MTLKEIVAGFTKNPVALLKYLLFSLDHTDKGASIKKLLAWVFAACIVFLHWCVYKYEFAAAVPNFQLWSTIFFGDIAVVGGLIGVNFFQEAHLKNLSQRDAFAQNKSDNDITITEQP